MENQKLETLKREWDTPILNVFGDVQTLTQQDKRFGASDGFTVQGVPIGNNS